MAGPRGIGIYFSKLPKESPSALAKKLADHGITWAVVCGPWHDAKGSKLINKRDAIDRFAGALAGRDIALHIWGYPWHDRIEPFLMQMAHSSPNSVAGWLLDPELGLRKKPAALRTLIDGSREILGGGLLGLTSYGSTKISFPWREVKNVDYGSPQLYTVGTSLLRKRLVEWQELGLPQIAPSFGLYTKGPTGNRRKTAAELDAHFEDFLEADFPVRALTGWSYRWIAPSHWPVIARWAERLSQR